MQGAALVAGTADLQFASVPAVQTIDGTNTILMSGEGVEAERKGKLGIGEDRLAGGPLFALQTSKSGRSALPVFSTTAHR